jgi:ABC-2 type transport system permease protein
MARRLVWLKSRLLWNGLKSDWQRRVGMPLIIGLIGWLAVELSQRHLDVFADLSPQAAAQFSAWSALAFFLIWVTLPVVIFPIDEHLDPAQFALAPISGPALVTGLAAASLVSPSVVMPITAMVVNTYEWRRVGVVAVVAALLFLVLVIISSQLFTVAISSILRSRRGRDLSVFIIAGIGLTAFSSQSIIRSTVARLGIEGAVTSYPITGFSYVLPPVAIVRIVTDASEGLWVSAFAHALASVGWIALLAYAWHRLLQRSLTTPEQSAGPRRTSRSTVGLVGRRGWSPTIVMARKELRFYLRDPRQRLVWTGAAIFVGLALASILLGTSTVADIRDRGWLPLASPALVLFVGLPIALNLFGWERNAASFLFVMPAHPRKLLIGKNLAAGSALLAETAILAMLVAAVTDSWGIMPLVPSVALCAILSQLAVGNLVSVITPLRLPREGTDVFAQATEQGCLAIGAQMVSFFAIGVLLIPPASVATLTVSFGQVIPPWVLAVFAPVWGLFFYGISLFLAGRILRRRLPEVAQWVQVS